MEWGFRIVALKKYWPNKYSVRSIQYNGGFTLATLLVISTTLMIMGAAILQGTLSVKNALNDQYYNELAREAAEAGVKYAKACVAQNATWSELRPNTNCNGGANGTAPSFVVETDTYRTTFTVKALDVRSDNSTLATSRGTTELLRRESGTAYKTYTETLGEAVGASSMSVIPIAKSMDLGGSAMDDTMGYFVGYDGQVYGSGDNGSGRLGDGTTTDRTTPVRFQLPSGLSAQKVSAAYNFTAVLASNGQVYWAGANVNGQLGDGSTTARSTPVRFQLPAGIFATDVIAGGGGAGYNIYVLGSNGRVYGAGANNRGQLTGTNTANQLTPKLLPLPSGMVRVKKMTFPRATNDTLSLVILGTNGTVWGVGVNDDMQLGSTDRTDKTSFIQLAIPGGIRASDIKTGYHSTFVHAANGQVYGYGQGITGELGNGSTTQWQATGQLFDLPGTRTVQKLYPASSSKVANTGDNEQASTFVISSDHQVYGSGQNHNGQLGDASMTNRSWPVRFALPGSLTAVDMDAKYFTTCVLASDKQVYCAGRNQFGQLGDGTTTNRSTPVKFNLPAGLFAVDVKVSFSEVFVSASDGKVYAAGRNNGGQLGVGDKVNKSTPTVMRMPTVPLNRTPLTASLSFIGTRVLASDGQVYSVGRNTNGEFGNGQTSDPQIIPARFQLPEGYAIAVKAGFYGTYVLSSTGQVYGAGRNNNYQLGISDTTDQLTPVKHPLNNIFASRWARDFFVSTSPVDNVTSIVASNNQLYSTGTNTQGQIGNGTTTPVTQASASGLFQLPAGVSVMKAFFGTNNTTFVLGSNEVLYGAGNNENGRLGIGNETNPITTPTQMLLPAGCYLEDMEPGTYVSYALCRNGDVYSVGLDSQGQLCNNATLAKQSTPVKWALPAGVTGVKLIVPKGANTGFVHVLASDGGLYGCGDNGFGQLGDGTTIDRPTPVKAIMPSGVTVVDAWSSQGGAFMLGSDGNIYGVGRNTSGQLGVGDGSHRSTPTRVLLPSGVLGQWAVNQSGLNSLPTQGTNDYFSGFLGSNGKLYTAGYNVHGQLGDGTTTMRPSPVELQLPQPAPQPAIIF